MRVLIIIGAPGSGKSTLMLNIIAASGVQCGTRHRHGLLDYTDYGQFDVLGYYTAGETFGGTDRLSQVVGDDARAYLAEAGGRDRTVALEGDRLANSGFLAYCRSIAETRIVCLEVDPAVLADRRALRSFEVGKEQNPTWLKGRETKVANLAREFAAERREVNTLAENRALAEELARWLRYETTVEIAQPVKPLRLF
jgi:hypothetical protein